ncbi:MAG: metallophosphoesterase family protein [Solirubrobacterales bacterium]|nr:metallophosphoesterase family protein [Solirubrobacterales bacterium]
MRLAIISDTHMPRGGRRLPDACLAQIRASDLLLHAGDLVDLATLEGLRALGPPVEAVAGNVDGPAVRAVLPADRVLELDGCRLAMIHDAGPREGRAARMRRRFPDADAVVFGHSHLPLHEQAPDGFQLFNPGSPTERRRAPSHTMGVGRIRGGRLELELLVLD